MKVGVQTIIWGPRPADFCAMCDSIRDAGYLGVEVFQRPEVLGSIEKLLRVLEDRDLELIGLAGGSLKQRMEFCGDYRPGYLYVENWNDSESREAIRKGFTLALHPHLYTQIHRAEDARQLLLAHPELKFLPDTAHLSVAHDDPVAVICENYDRIIAVHFKDWVSDFGRSPHRYARGFVELGQGQIDIAAVLRELKARSFEGWIIAEQDYSRTTPEDSISKSAAWLVSQQLELRSRPPRPATSSLGLSYEAPEASVSQCDTIAFLQACARAGSARIDSCWATLCGAFSQLLPSQLITLWSCNQAEQLLMLVATDPHFCPTSSITLDVGETLTRETLLSQFVQLIDLEGDAARHSPEHELAKGTGAKWLVSIPVMNVWNPHQVWLVVNCFRNTSELPISKDDLFEFGRYAGMAASAAVAEHCSAAATRISALAERSKAESQFLNELAELTASVVGCEAASVFLLDPSGEKLVLKASTGLTLSNNAAQSYSKGDDFIWTALDRNQVLLVRNARERKDYSRSIMEEVGSPQLHQYLCAPLVHSGTQALGVIRCRNKQVTTSSSVSRSFNDEDVAVLEAIAQAVVPHLQMIRINEQRIDMLDRLTHELRAPLTVVRNAVDVIGCVQGIRALLPYDYLDDILSWTTLMDRLITNADVLSRTSPPPLEIERIYLVKGVIAPAVRQVEPLLQERKFSSKQITYDAFVSIPRIHVDRNYWQQIVFNLLSNAIKYAYKDVDAFRIEISSAHIAPSYYIYFRDWGPGVNIGLEERIFEDRFRSGDARVSVAGQGIGLWVVRRLVQAHNGTVTLTKNAAPCEFTIVLPDYLSKKGPHLSDTRR